MCRVARLAVTAVLCCCLASIARADDFRIETKVYTGKGKIPVSENSTLFHAGYVYDYLVKPDRVAVFDPARGRFILLDPVKKEKAEVKTEEVRKLVDGLHDLAAKSTNPAMRFAADPAFEINFDDNGTLLLASKHITYELATQPAATPRAAEQYHEFSDWYARFNTMAAPGSVPPFPRLVVNSELAKRGLVPTEVKMTFRSVSARTEHLVTWRLLETDLQKIARTANHLTTFKQVDLEDLQMEQVTSR